MEHPLWDDPEVRLLTDWVHKKYNESEELGRHLLRVVSVSDLLYRRMCGTMEPYCNSIEIYGIKIVPESSIIKYPGAPA